MIERVGGFTVGTVEEGQLTIGAVVVGNLTTPGPSVLKPVGSEGQVVFNVEADALTEDQANELLGFIRD
ncbi:MAG: hypothetical protein ABWX83_02265 [Luteibacter sp.]